MKLNLATSIVTVYTFLTRSALVASHLAQSSGIAKHLIHQYPNGTWIENLAIRCNGQILVTDSSSPHLYSIDPFSGVSSLVHTFSNATGAVGITETTEDSFFVVVGNFSLSSYLGVAGSFRLYSVEYGAEDKSEPVIAEFMDLPGAKFMDGLTTLDAERDLILAADINQGNILRIDLRTKTANVAINDSLLDPGLHSTIGVDGIKIRDDILYFTNPGRNIIGKIAIDKDANPQANAVVVQPIGGDDFTFDQAGNIFTVGGSNNLTEIYGPDLKVLKNLTTLPGPTAAAFGRTSKDIGCLYVTTSGGDGAYSQSPVLVGGGLYAVDVYNNGSCPTYR